MSFEFLRLESVEIGVDKDTHEMALRAKYADKDRCKSIPLHRWDPNQKLWVYPLCPAVVAGLEKAFEISPRLKERLLANALPDPEHLAAKVTPPHIEIAESDNCFSIFSTYDCKEKCRSVPGGIWDKERRCWKYGLTHKALSRALQLFPGYPVEGADKEALLKELSLKMADEEKASRALDAEVEVENLGGELLPYQRAAVAYALKTRRCFIADEMGLGKTVEALATLQAAEAFPALVVTPAVVKLNWRSEARRWLPGRSIAILGGKSAAPKKKAKAEKEVSPDEADIVIINYDVLSKHEELASLEFKALVLDECHYVKNPQAKRTQQVYALSKNIPMRLLLSGTPLLSRPVELLPQLMVLDRLQELGGRQFFLKHYCDAKMTKWGMDYSGAKNLKELNTELRRICYVRRNKKAVLTELPEKRITRVALGMDREHFKQYVSLMEDFKSYLIRQAKLKGKARSEVDRSLKAEGLTKLNAAKQVVAQGKLSEVIAWVETFLSSEEKLVLFAVHLDIIAALKEHFTDAVSITGSDSAESRFKAVESFQNDENVRLIILQLQAGGVGITLTAASNVAFAELGWTPGEHEQAEDRCHRIGQENAVNCWYLVAEGTVEEDIEELIGQKRAVVSAAADGKRIKAGNDIFDDLSKRMLLGAEKEA